MVSTARRSAAQRRRRRPMTVARSVSRPMTADQERGLANEYARAMGWDLTPDERAAAFKESTEGARMVDHVMARVRRTG